MIFKYRVDGHWVWASSVTNFTVLGKGDPDNIVDDIDSFDNYNIEFDDPDKCFVVKYEDNLGSWLLGLEITEGYLMDPKTGSTIDRIV